MITFNADELRTTLSAVLWRLQNFALVMLLASTLAHGSVARAQEYKTVELPVSTAEKKDPRSDTTFSDILRSILLESLKSEYVDERHWGATTRRFDGFRVQGTRISKREREINHGIWRRFRVNLIQPEKNFHVQFAQLEPTADGEIPFSIRIRLRARCESTFAWWTYGVKGVNGTTVSDVTLQLQMVLNTSPRLKFDLQSALPKVELRPQIASLSLELKDLDVRRFGVFHGDVVKVLGDGATEAVEELIQQQEGKIRKKLQQKLDEAVTQ